MGNSTNAANMALPAIRCSDCGAEVDLLMMSEHTCTRQAEAFPPTQMAAFSKGKQSMHSSSPFAPPAGFVKQARAPPPPRIQTNAIGRPFVPPNELTPASSGRGSDAISPRSATSGRSPFRIPARAMAQPIRARPPSPELTNLDCAFPAFPTMSSRSVTPVSDTRSQNSDGESLFVKEHAEPYKNISPPVSRQGTPDSPFARRGSANSSDSRKRSKTLTDGQDAVRRPSTAASNRRPSFGSVSGVSRPDIRNAPALPSPLITVINGLPSPSTSESVIASSPSYEETRGVFSNPASLEQSQDSAFLSPTASRPRDYAPFSRTMVIIQGVPQRGAPPPEAAPREVSEDFLHPAQGRGAPSFSSNGPAYRAKRPLPLSNQPLNCTIPTGTQFKKPSLFPGRSPTLPLLPEPSQSPSLEPGQLTRRPSEPSPGPPGPWPFTIPTIQAYTSTPSESVAESQSIDRSGSNHSPADSASSYESISSVAQDSTSSRSSALVPEDFSFRRHDRPSALDHTQQMHSEPLPQPTAPILNYQADSPTDPLFQQGRLTPVPAEGVQRTELAPEAIVRTSTAPLEQTHRAPETPLLQRSKTTGTSKGQCRGCSKVIAGGQKSVSSADGRLTGRFHKDCFSCTTCHNSFATADFYVHQDKPYCAQHYHVVNGSLCVGCGHGIEGQYLEAMRNTLNRQEKFHPNCLTCVLCRTVLKGDYFAHDGRFFCERDIQRVAGPRNCPTQYPGSPPTRMGPGPSQLSAPSQRPSRYPERRTTKLMMM